MKIKVKAKTVIISLVLIIVLVPLVNMALADYFSNSGKVETASELYDYYLKYPNSLRKDEALYKKSKATMNGFRRYSIMMGMKLGEKKLDHTSVNKAMEDYEKIISHYPESNYYALAYQDILNSHIYLGYRDDLEKWIDWGKDKANEEIRGISILYEGYDYFANREFDEAEEVLENFLLGNDNLDYIYYFLKGHMEFAKEDFPKALEYYHKASEIGLGYRTNFFGSTGTDIRTDWLENLDFKEGEHKIRGRVTADGVGIPYVEVYLQKPRQGYSTRGMNFIAITDKDGYYETIGIKEGQYDLGIGIGTPIMFDKAYLEKDLYNIQVSEDIDFDFEFKASMNIISPETGEIVKGNKFEIIWEEIKGAAYYNVKVVGVKGGTMFTSTIMDENKEYNIKGNKGVFNIENLKNAPSGYSIDEDGIVSPEAIMGYFYRDISIYIMVDAYDENGNILSSSAPMTNYYDGMPSIKIEDKLTEGEELIVKSKYKNAIDYYEDLISKDEDNIEALSYLSKLYIFGWGKGTKDPSMAMEYGMKVYDITGNADVILRVLGQMDSIDYRKNKEMVGKIFDIMPDEYRDKYFHWYRGLYYRALGEFQKAREDFIKGEIDSESIVYMDIYLGEYKRAIDFLGNENTNFYYINKSNLIDGIQGLEKLDKDNKDYIIFKEYLYGMIVGENSSDDLDKAYERRKEDFKKIHSSIKEPSIRTILEEIKADNSWDI